MNSVVIIVLVSLLLLIIEYVITAKSVNSISLRIHVNGTRGKSTVTRYIAAGLRASGKETIGKITGVVPTIILKDGSEQKIKRRGSARVQEQFKIIRLAGKLNCNALVLECMSIQPELQKLESRIFKPHIYVITNIRNDHREQMGENINEQAKAICCAIPVNAKVITNEKNNLALIKNEADLYKSKVVPCERINDTNENILPPGVFKENIELALTACIAAGIEKNSALNAIINEAKKTASPVIEFNSGKNKIIFINGFAVNDVHSARKFINCWQNKPGTLKKLNIIFNTRSDRPFRSIEFAKWFKSVSNISKLILTGNHIPKTKTELRKNGFEQNNILTWTKKEIREAKKTIGQMVYEDSTFIGLGNIAGDGFLILDSIFRND